MNMNKIRRKKYLRNAELNVLRGIRQNVALRAAQVGLEVLLVVVDGQVAVLHGGVIVLRLHVGRRAVQVQFAGERPVVLGQVEALAPSLDGRAVVAGLEGLVAGGPGKVVVVIMCALAKEGHKSFEFNHLPIQNSVHTNKMKQ